MGNALKIRVIRAIAAGLIAPALYCAPAAAADLTVANDPVVTAEDAQPNSSRWGRNADYWEVRFGGAAYDFGPATRRDFSGGVVNAEILVPSPGFLARIGAPRPYLGTDIAISDDAIHVVYLGLNWEVYLTEKLYLGIAGGGAWNSSSFTASASGATKDLGSSVLFHLQASLGFDISRNWTMQIFYNHFSNANVSGSNAGLESIGARLGKRF